MKLQQLRYLCEVAANGFSVSAAAATLHTAQPGISKQILLLEEELGVELFVRRNNRLIALTRPGAEVVALARQMLQSAENIHAVTQDQRGRATGDLIVATTHTYARYLLPKVIKAFAQRYPDVRLAVWQGPPAQIVAMVEAGEADIGLSSRPPEVPESLATIPCYELKHSLVAPKGHAILGRRKITLAGLAAHPIIAWGLTHEIGRQIAACFAAARLSPRIVMRAIDSDVMKAYVAEGLGIAIVPTVAFDAKQDKSLGARSVDDLFERSITYATLRRNSYIRGYMFDFLELFSPALARANVEEALRRGRGRPAA